MRGPGPRAGRGRAAAVLAGCLLASASLLAQTAGAELRRQPKPVYPDNLSKALLQGNVVLIGRIDVRGRVEDIRVVSTSHEQFVEPALEAVRAWEFRPATQNGKPIEVAANICLRFRLSSNKRGEIPRPALGDLAVFPADAAGKASAPDGFPIRRGGDPRLRAEAVIDLSPDPKPRTMTIKAEAVSPRGRRIPLYERPVSVAAGAADARVSLTADVGADWEDGVWMLKFFVNQAEAGGGQFWLTSGRGVRSGDGGRESSSPKPRN